MEYFDNDPEQGGKEISFWQFITDNGLIDYLQNSGMIINPTHDFEKLKIHRQNIYEVDERDYIRNLKINNQKITKYKLRCHYVDWLKNELIVIEQWLSNKYPNGKYRQILSFSDQIEIEKYRDYVNSEIANNRKIIMRQSNRNYKKHKK